MPEVSARGLSLRRAARNSFKPRSPRGVVQRWFQANAGRNRGARSRRMGLSTLTSQVRSAWVPPSLGESSARHRPSKSPLVLTATTCPGNEIRRLEDEIQVVGEKAARRRCDPAANVRFATIEGVRLEINTLPPSRKQLSARQNLPHLFGGGVGYAPALLEAKDIAGHEDLQLLRCRPAEYTTQP